MALLFPYDDSGNSALWAVSDFIMETKKALNDQRFEADTVEAALLHIE